jgi:hypothetical protein
MITESFIEKFFQEKSNIQDRFIGFNFLYNETKEITDYNANEFDETTLSWIKEKEADLKFRLEYLKRTHSQENTVNIEENIHVIEGFFDFQKTKASWLKTVINVQNSYNEYLKEMKNIQINYIIISEAPLLKFSEEGFSCNYILDKKIKSAGSYRTAPFHALNRVLTNKYNRENTNEITASDLINFCKKNGIAFMDLIPIPLPELNTKLREHWSINPKYFIESEKPRVITFLEIAFEYFMNKTNCNIDPNVKIALMMPPKTSLGILNFFINDKKTSIQKLNDLSKSFIIENTNKDAKEFPDRLMRLHKAVVMSGAGGPNEELIYNAFK